jgi:undecaprenyl diphosphate synthase
MAISNNSLKHVAIIMDGNRRWAKDKGLPTLAGHAQGVESLKRLVRYFSDHQIEALTVYAFSTENWNRSEEEVGYLMKLFIQSLSKELNELHRQHVRLSFIGDLSPFPKELRTLLDESITQTQANQRLKLQVAINYGSQAELTRAAKLLAEEVQQGSLQADEIDEKCFARHLYTHGLPDVDLLIRTGGDARISNFLLWQCAYTEFYFTPVLWPDFNEQAMQDAIVEFERRQRRFGQ